ncbi:hypothetical protein GGP91_002119 [Salinibacter ruber]|nr:hypothetical protein [Salinibacter ruber]
MANLDVINRGNSKASHASEEESFLSKISDYA